MGTIGKGQQTKNSPEFGILGMLWGWLWNKYGRRYTDYWVPYVGDLICAKEKAYYTPLS